MSEVDFESSLKKLEQIVLKLEQGDVSLDESLKAFEEGVGLVRSAQKSLQSAKSRIEILTQEGQNEDV